MDSLFESLALLTDRPLGTVVHIGAGNGMVLARYADLAPERVVLVEGDTNTAAQLKRRAVGLACATVRAQAVAAQEGSLPWHRYSLPGLNGPIDCTVLTNVYPRLRLSGSSTLQAHALSDLLVDLALAGGTDRSHVLVLDVPGQEVALLASVCDNLLTRFDAVLIKGCRETLTADDVSLDELTAELAGRCYDPVAGNVQHEPLWPVALLRLDRQRHQNVQLQQTVAAVQAENATLTARVQALDRHAAEQRQQVGLLSANDAQLALAAQRGQAKIDALVRARSQSEQTARDLAAQVEQLTHERDVLTCEQGKVLALAAERAEFVLQAEALTQSNDAMCQTVSQRQAEIDAVNQAMDQFERTVRDRDAEIAQLTRDRDALMARLAQVETLEQERVELITLAEERLTELHANSRELVAAEQIADDHAARIAQLTQECKALEASRAALQAEVLRIRATQAALTLPAAGLQHRQAEIEASNQVMHQAERDAHAQATHAELARQIRSLERDLADARQTASLTIKLKMLREADLRDLQVRYQAVIAQQQSQHELLTQLAQRLTLAHQYFDQLAHSGAALAVLPVATRKPRSHKPLSLAASAVVRSGTAATTPPVEPAKPGRRGPSGA